LRHRNEILSAKIEMVDLFALVLHTQAAHRLSGAMHPDPLWLLQRELENLTAKKEPGREPDAAELGAAIRASGQVGKGMSSR